MVQVDLITGFLGAGKTTFLRRYVRYLVEQGHNVCILENDFGAVNVDAMLVHRWNVPPFGFYALNISFSFLKKPLRFS